jgi:hypothetical protein
LEESELLGRALYEYSGAGAGWQAENRAEFEDELVAAIARPRIQATQSYVFLARPNATPIDLNGLKAVIREQKFDAIVVTRLTKADICSRPGLQSASLLW